MKATSIMFFMIIFNVMISVVGLLHIYNMGGISGSVAGQTATTIGTPGSGDSSLWIFGATMISTTIVGGIFGTLVSVLTKQPAADGVAYGTFGGLITGVFISSYNILWSIVNTVPSYAQLGVAIVVGLFLGITGLLFIIGFIQLIRGGMKLYI